MFGKPHSTRMNFYKNNTQRKGFFGDGGGNGGVFFWGGWYFEVASVFWVGKILPVPESMMTSQMKKSQTKTLYHTRTPAATTSAPAACLYSTPTCDHMCVEDNSMGDQECGACTIQKKDKIKSNSAFRWLQYIFVKLTYEESAYTQKKSAVQVSAFFIFQQSVWMPLENLPINL